jgi:hypothetical protein
MSHLRSSFAIRKPALGSQENKDQNQDAQDIPLPGVPRIIPKEAVANGERRAQVGHQSQSVSTLLLEAEAGDQQADRGRLEQRVRSLTGRADVQITEVRPKQDAAGRVVGYEVDIK